MFVSPPVLGGAICVFMIQFIRVPSLKISTLLLVGLLLYDVFWVSMSASATEIDRGNLSVSVSCCHVFVLDTGVLFLFPLQS